MLTDPKTPPGGALPRTPGVALRDLDARRVIATSTTYTRALFFVPPAPGQHFVIELALEDRRDLVALAAGTARWVWRCRCVEVVMPAKGEPIESVIPLESVRVFATPDIMSGLGRLIAQLPRAAELALWTAGGDLLAMAVAVHQAEEEPTIEVRQGEEEPTA